MRQVPPKTGTSQNSTSNLSTEHHQPGPSPFTGQLRIGTLFPVSGLCKCNTVCIGRSRPGRPISSQRGDHGGVDCQLSSLPETQTVRDHFEAPAIESVELCKVHVPHEHISRDSSASLSAHLRGSTLQDKTPLCENPCLSARCTMVAKKVELAATLASALGQGKRQMESPAQEEAEWLGVQSHHTRSWQSGQGSEANGPC